MPLFLTFKIYYLIEDLDKTKNKVGFLFIYFSETILV